VELSQGQSIPLRSRLANTGYIDRWLIDNRAFKFADTAANAEIYVNPGLFDAPLLALSPDHKSLFKPDGLLGSRAVFLTDDTGDTMSKGETAALVDEGETDLGLHLFRLRKVTNRSGGADLAAQRAVVLAVPNPGNQDGRPDSFNPSLKQCGLKAIGETDLHALPTLDASLEKLPFR